MERKIEKYRRKNKERIRKGNRKESGKKGDIQKRVTVK